MATTVTRVALALVLVLAAAALVTVDAVPHHRLMRYRTTTAKAAAAATAAVAPSALMEQRTVVRTAAAVDADADVDADAAVAVGGRGPVAVTTTFVHSGNTYTVAGSAEDACTLSLDDSGKTTAVDAELFKGFDECPGLLAALQKAFGLHVTPKHVAVLQFVRRISFAGENAPKAVDPTQDQVVPVFDPKTLTVTVELHELVGVHALRRSVAGVETDPPVLCAVGPKSHAAFTWTTDRLKTCEGAVLKGEKSEHFKAVGRPGLPDTDAQVDRDFVVVFEAWAKVQVRAFIGANLQQTATDCGATADAHGTFDDTLVSLCAAQVFDPTEYGNPTWTTADVKLVVPKADVGGALVGPVTVVLAPQTVLLRVVGPNDAVVAERVYAVGGTTATFTLNDKRIDAVARAALDDAHKTLHHSGDGAATFTVGDLFKVDQPDGKQKVAKFTADRAIAGGAGSVLYLRQPAVVKAHAAGSNANTAVACYLVQHSDKQLAPATVLGACGAKVAPGAQGHTWSTKDVKGLATTHSAIVTAGDVTLVVTAPVVVMVQAQGSSHPPVECRRSTTGSVAVKDVLSDCGAAWVKSLPALEQPIGGTFKWTKDDVVSPAHGSTQKASFTLVLKPFVVVTASRVGAEDDKFKCASGRSGELQLTNELLGKCAVAAMNGRNVYDHAWSTADLEAVPKDLTASVELQFHAPVIVTGTHKERSFVCATGRTVKVTDEFVRKCYAQVVTDEALRPLKYADATASVADVTIGSERVDAGTELKADTTVVFHPPVVVSAKKDGANDNTAVPCHAGPALAGVTFSAEVAKACAELALTVKQRGGKDEWSRNDFVASVDLSQPLKASLIVGAKAAGVTITVRARLPDNSLSDPIACKEAEAVNSLQFGDALFQECGDLAVKLPNTCALCKPTYTRDTVAEVVNANGDKLAANKWPVKDAKIAADLLLVLDQPLVVKVLQNVAGQNGQNTHFAAVARYAAKKLNAAFVTALNADLSGRKEMAGLTIAGKQPNVALDAGASLDVVCRANGRAVIAWDANLQPTDTIDCEYFPSFAPLFADNQPFAGATKIAWENGGKNTLPEHRTMYRAVAAHDNVKLDTTDQDSVALTKPKSDEVFYLNCGSGKFVNDVDAARTKAWTALYTANGKTKPFAMSHAGLWTALTGASGTGSPARVLKRSLEAAHGNAFVHFGYGYFDIHVKVWKTIDMSGANLAHAAQKRIGWVCAAHNHRAVEIRVPRRNDDDLVLYQRNGAGMHSEQRCLEYLRLFVRKLEASAKNNVKMQVTRIESRWVNEWYPDEIEENHCMWALQYVQLSARAGYFREAQYNEWVRLNRLDTRNDRRDWVLKNPPVTDDVNDDTRQYKKIAFGAPKIHYLYDGVGKQQRRNHACDAITDEGNDESLCRTASTETLEKEANALTTWRSSIDDQNNGYALDWANDWTLGTL